MYPILPLLVLMMLLGIVGCDVVAEEPTTAAKQGVVKGDNAFGFDLNRQLRSQEGNLFFSPYSISTALSMTYAGAKGKTAEEMAHVLHLSENQDKLHPAVASVAAELTGNNTGVRLDIANALWGQRGQPFVPTFLQLTKTYYGAGLHEVDFRQSEAARQEINAWVEKQTQDKIKELLGRGSVDGATLVLTNAIYFKGDWNKPFLKGMTRKQAFTTGPDNKVSVDMMHLTEKFGYLETAQFQALSMPYKGDAVEMVVLLPKKKDGLKEVEELLNERFFSETMGKMKSVKVVLSLPKFKMTSSFELADTLGKMGMPTLFQPGKADLSGIVATHDLFISKVVHKAYVDVNEEGAEAAAATGMIGVRMSAQQAPMPVFLADHPFVFAIRDKKNGAILFFGRLANPER